LNKETSHRSHELKEIGWNSEDITRYEELWEYSQRWGLINLEREDRQFLKKAEKLIPKLQPKKTSNKKLIEDKSYFLWLNFYFNEIKEFNNSNLSKDVESVWSIMIEEEMNLLKKYSPVMGLPDTLKAKDLKIIRKQLIDKAFSVFNAKKSEKLFDFNLVYDYTKQKESKSWKSLVENDLEVKDQFPLIDKKNRLKFSEEANKEIENYMLNNYPSLKGHL
tara:strand:+ start:5247 stop:5906 length:660 start_codon:yes stop_codon:yes gene_type:complete